MADAKSSSAFVGSPLADPKRYITSTNTEAKAIFSAITASIEPIQIPGGALLRLGYQTSRPPVTFADNKDITTYQTLLESPPPPVPSGGGSAVWYIDTPPGASSPLHRTVSLDIAVQLEGETELQLDGGEARLLKPGDMAVQRATMHAWRNPSETRWSRMIGIMSECDPVMVGSETLGAFPPPST